MLRSFYFLIASLLITPQLWAGEIIRDHPVQQIAESTYVIIGPRGFPSVENQGFMNNPAWVVTDKGVIVIDPGSSLQAGRMVMKRIRELTDKPVTHVFSTHIHGDHWLGNHAITELYPDAVIMGHPDMIKKAHDGEGEQWIQLMSSSTNGFTDGTIAVIPNTEVIDSQILKINGKTFRIYAPGKAHSGANIMIEYVEDSVVFTGDNVLYTRMARMDDATFQGNIDACQVALDINAKHYVPGHGPAGGTEVPATYKKYLETIYHEVARLYEEDLAAFEMKAPVVKKLAAYSEWINFEDEVGKHISLALLEVEENAFWESLKTHLNL
ncbi:MBL fold metallo-hydrolase [Solemya velesiana gill symbiont]|uniref:MBL fold metallo-hydrolase n=1 Tax=Solemya velesiana gill symbiont TaxID=1918948 RepID=A0A1T2KSS0_9GAMM|nr:MBL fold metallo-hydrolase [Solemya velesiana gill symbiont]OOZ35750.1 MBL fold metallo-hydrolase [Solemya velesiana gill symbiont]